MRKVSSVVFCLLASVLACSVAGAQGPPPGWGQKEPLPPANGAGEVAFKQGATAMTLPLNKMEVQLLAKDMRQFSLKYVDPKQENTVELAFMLAPALPLDERAIGGFNVRTKAGGFSKASSNKTKCKLAITKNDAREVAGTLSCTGMTDMSATQAAPDVTGVTFNGKMK